MIDLKKKSPADMVLHLAEKNPGMTFAISDSGTAIGVWNPKLEKYQTILSLTICSGSPWSAAFDLKVNGKLLWTYDKANKPEAA